jgi:hypothetical protein
MQTVDSNSREWPFTGRGSGPTDLNRPRYGPNTKELERLFHGILTLPEQELLKIASLGGDRPWRLRAEKAMVEAIDRAERAGMRYELVGAIGVAGSVGEAVTARYAMSPPASSGPAGERASSVMPVTLAVLSAAVALVTREVLTDDEFDLLYRPMMLVGAAMRQPGPSDVGPSNRSVGLRSRAD